MGESFKSPIAVFFADYMEERLAPNSVRQYATKLKSVLNLYNEEVELT